MMALYVPTLSMCSPVCGGPPLTEKVYDDRSMVRQSARSVL
jgi:hypothetical protein